MPDNQTPGTPSDSSAAVTTGGDAGTAAAKEAKALEGFTIGLDIAAEFDTLDGLRKISIGFEEDTKGTEHAFTINFVLQERAKTTDAFVTIVNLHVFLVPSVLGSKEKADQANQQAKLIAGGQGLSPAQQAHLAGPAADDAKDAEAGIIPKEDAQRTVAEALLKK